MKITTNFIRLIQSMMEISKNSKMLFSALIGLMIQKCNRTIFHHQNSSIHPVIMCIKMSQFMKNVFQTLLLSKNILVQLMLQCTSMTKIYFQITSVKNLFSVLPRFCMSISMKKIRLISFLTCKIINQMTKLIFSNLETLMKQNLLLQFKEHLQTSRFLIAL